MAKKKTRKGHFQTGQVDLELYGKCARFIEDGMLLYSGDVMTSALLEALLAVVHNEGVTNGVDAAVDANNYPEATRRKAKSRAAAAGSAR